MQAKLNQTSLMNDKIKDMRLRIKSNRITYAQNVS